MSKIEHSVVINSPLEEVFTFFTNFENNPQWEQGILDAKQTPPGQIKVGTQLAEVRKFMGRRVETTYEVIKYEPNRQMVIKSTNGPMGVVGSYSFEPATQGTKVTDSAEFETKGFFKLIEPLFNRMVKKTMINNFAKAKSLLEKEK